MSVAVRAKSRPPKERRRRVAHKGAIGMFLTPFGVLFGLFYLLPIGYAIWQSLLVVERDGTYGAPRQDLWIQRYLPALDVGVAIGVGGVLDYLSGRVQRAPVWVRRLELEWLYRLIRQSWRWRRQTALVEFGLLALAAALRDRVSARPAPVP